MTPGVSRRTNTNGGPHRFSSHGKARRPNCSASAGDDSAARHGRERIRRQRPLGRSDAKAERERSAAGPTCAGRVLVETPWTFHASSGTPASRIRRPQLGGRNVVGRRRTQGSCSHLWGTGLTSSKSPSLGWARPRGRSLGGRSSKGRPTPLEQGTDAARTTQPSPLRAACRDAGTTPNVRSYVRYELERAVRPAPTAHFASANPPSDDACDVANARPGSSNRHRGG